jgi:hypothetical protein
MFVILSGQRASDCIREDSQHQIQAVKVAQHQDSEHEHNGTEVISHVLHHEQDARPSLESYDVEYREETIDDVIEVSLAEIERGRLVVGSL